MLVKRSGFRSFMTRYFSTEAITWEQIFALFFPLMAETAFRSGFAIINSSMISSGGMQVLSAVSLVDTFTSVLTTLFSGITAGASVVVAQYRGARDQENLSLASNLSILSSVSISFVISVLCALFRAPIFKLFFGGAEQEVIDLALPYMFWACLTIPLYTYMLAELAVLRSIGEGKVALGITLVQTLLYVGCNFLFIIVLKWSIQGLIYSVLISRIAVVFLCPPIKRLMHSEFRYRFRELFRWDGAMMKRIIHLSVPIALGNVLFDASRLVIQMIIVPLGTQAVSAYNIVFNLIVFSQIPIGSWSSTVFTACGMTLGAGNHQDVKKLKRSSGLFCTALSILGSAIILLFSDFFIQAFHPEEEMVPIVFRSLVIMMAAQSVLYAPSFQTCNILASTGDTRFTSVAAVVSAWLLRAFGAYLFGIRLNLGVTGVFIAMTMDWIMRSILFSARFHRGKWEKITVI